MGCLAYLEKKTIEAAVDFIERAEFSPRRGGSSAGAAADDDYNDAADTRARSRDFGSGRLRGIESEEDDGDESENGGSARMWGSREFFCDFRCSRGFEDARRAIIS